MPLAPRFGRRYDGGYGPAFAGTTLSVGVLAC